MSELLRLQLVCNGDAGEFEGCARRIRVANIVDLTAVSDTRPPRLAFVEFDGCVRQIRLSGRYFPVTAFANYMGNERTAAVVMEVCVVAELLNFVRMRGFLCDGGDEGAAEQWYSGGRFTADSLRRVM